MSFQIEIHSIIHVKYQIEGVSTNIALIFCVSSEFSICIGELDKNNTLCSVWRAYDLINYNKRSVNILLIYCLFFTDPMISSILCLQMAAVL